MRRLEITVSEGTWDRLNAARGFEPRASFVKRALESALGRSTELPREASSPASSRAPVEKEPGITVGGVTASESPAGAGPVPSRRAMSPAMVRQQALNKPKGI